MEIDAYASTGDGPARRSLRERAVCADIPGKVLIHCGPGRFNHSTAGTGHGFWRLRNAFSWQQRPGGRRVGRRSRQASGGSSPAGRYPIGFPQQGHWGALSEGPPSIRLETLPVVVGLADQVRAENRRAPFLTNSGMRRCRVAATGSAYPMHGTTPRARQDPPGRRPSEAEPRSRGRLRQCRRATGADWWRGRGAAAAPTQRRWAASDGHTWRAVVGSGP
jgi:hypothetical protein